MNEFWRLDKPAELEGTAVTKRTPWPLMKNIKHFMVQMKLSRLLLCVQVFINCSLKCKERKYS